MEEEERITDLPVAVSIDSVTDTFPIVNDALDETQQINRNVFLGVTGQPADISTIQTISNKIFNNTNLVTLLDGSFTLQNNVDTTKRALFSLAGITTATTRTYTLPNASSTLADISTAQTLTNKTLTSPTITGGSITNPTLSVDAISEFTAANGVTIDGLNIKDAKLNSNNSVVTSNITDSAVTPNKLLAGTGTGWTWQTWSPTLTNLTLGNGVQVAKYIQIGKTVFFQWDFTLGNTSSVGSNPTITFPVATVSTYGVNRVVGTGYGNANTANAPLWANWQSTTTFNINVYTASGTYVTGITNATAAIPGTWATNGSMSIEGFYEAA